MLASSGIAFADFDAECTLSGSGAHDFGVLALFELAQARVDVAAQRMNVEIRADGFELSLTAKAGCAYTRTVWQFLKAGVVARAEGVARVLPCGDGSNFKSLGKFGGQVFQRMYGKIDVAVGEGFFNFFCEHALGADHGEGNVGNFVTGSMDDFDFDLVAARAQQCGDVVRLPEGELRAAGADAEFRHGARPHAGYWTKAKGGRLGRLRMVLDRA